MEDFNEILYASKKQGGRPCPVWQIRWFREALDSVDVYDLGFEGNPFTWCNHHSEPEIIYKRLDRVCVDFAWRSKFPNTVVHHIPTSSSDHTVLLIDIDNTCHSSRPKRRPFHFEAIWASDAECENIVREGWNSWSGDLQPSFLAKQKECVVRLLAWNSEKSSNSLNRQIRLQEKTLTQIHLRPISVENRNADNKIWADMEKLL
ncbi:UNVERIFIED_CONTAM: hypothetical protein Slati_2885000 [Sesamum latifolium]|uniref:Endonuclease/exonuclease/phosphatase domain-containing protein n=1 Tax=Sesamum latifolium TaxID=2727402 RepID=A0AAW2VD41_9LAMI